MPLMSGVPVVATPPTIARPARSPFKQDTRRVGFRDLDGNDILDRILDDGIRAVIPIDGLTGFDLPPRELVRASVPGMPGSRVREVRVGERTPFIPMFVSGYGHSDYLTVRDEVAAMLSVSNVNVAATGGTFDVVAYSERSERTLRCLYAEGMEGTYSQDVMGSWWESFGLSLLAVQPFWSGGEWTTPLIRTPTGARWFGHFPGKLASSRALSKGMSVIVDGDVPAWPSVDVYGPADAVTITASGLSVTVPGGLDTDEAFHLDTDPRGRVAQFDGDTDWTRVGENDKYRQLNPGENIVNITVTGATSATSARVYGPNLFERAW